MKATRCEELQLLGALIDELADDGEQKWLVHWMGQEWHDRYIPGGTLTGLQLHPPIVRLCVESHSSYCLVTLDELDLDRFLIFRRAKLPIEDLPTICTHQLTFGS